MTSTPAAGGRTLLSRLFERQVLHVIVLAALLAVVGVLFGRIDGATDGAFGGLSTRAWFWIVIASAIAHQFYTLIAWRLELYAGFFTSAFGRAGFSIYKVVFAILGLSRLLIVALAIADSGSIGLPGVLRWGLSGVFLALALYTFYSVIRYFGIDRAAGLDHFDRDAHTWPLVDRGIFRYTGNAMYTFGFLLMWVPGLVLESSAALLAAAFHHAYIWVHYHCTEKPDMQRIYGGGGW